jgi:inner membrane protein
MDSLSQLALGGAVGIAVMGRRTAVWKAALWGGLCGTLPDLDAFIDHGDPVSNMTLHRAESHALFYLSLLAPLLAGLIARLHGEGDRYRRWWLAVWLALVTHPLLDTMTVYGTQLALPFSERPWGVGSIFIIDPLYTLPLMLGVGGALLARDPPSGRRWNRAGLLLSTAYLVWSFAAQQYVAAVARGSLRAQGVHAQRLLVTPTPFNTLLWRIVVLTPEGYLEGFDSLLDGESRIAFDAFPRGKVLFGQLDGNRHAHRLAWFTHGFFKVADAGGRLVLSDLRMGQEPYYTFSFALAERRGESIAAIPPRLLGQRPDVARTLSWMGRRLFDPGAPPPR